MFNFRNSTILKTGSARYYNHNQNDIVTKLFSSYKCKEACTDLGQLKAFVDILKQLHTATKPKYRSSWKSLEPT